MHQSRKECTLTLATAAPLVVVALGGNAITREGQSGTYSEMLANCQEMAASVCALREAGWRVVITHGNGPQVGNLAIQQHAGSPEVPGQPLFALGAMTQGLIGHLLQMALLGTHHQQLGPVVGVVTHVIVDRQDEAFDRPSKPIGPFYSLHEAQARSDLTGHPIVEDSGRGYRITVPSTRPQAIVEGDAISRLSKDGYLVVAGGGGGIPLVERDGTLAGIEAVVDKDRSATLLATYLEADALLLVTGVECVLADFGKPTEREIHLADAAQMREYARQGQFPTGSMGPKVEAALDFIDASDGYAVITDASSMASALGKGETPGTRIVREIRGLPRQGAPA